jgi:tetratricopeptide (TPR) repeat protein
MNKIEKLIKAGIDAHSAGDPNKALTNYRKAYKLAPNNPKLLYFFGILEYQRDQNSHAEKLLEACSRLISGDADVEYNLGTVYQRLGKYKKAIKRFQNAISANPSMHLAHLNLGAAYICMEDYQQALSALMIAHRLSPTDEDTLFNIARAYESLNEYALSNQYASKLQASSKFFLDASLLIAKNHTTEGQIDKAIEILEDRLSAIQAKTVILARLGDLHFDNNHSQEAQKAYEQAIRLDDSNAGAYTGLSKLFFSQGKLEQAIEALEQGKQHCPQSQIIKSNTALINLSMGHFKEGWSDYIYRTGDRPLSLKPPFPRLAKNLEDQPIYLVYDQGLGDQLFFLRFVPLLLQRTPQVLVCVHEKLVPALESSTLSKLLVSERQIPLKGAIYELGDLPYLLDCTNEDIPPPLPLTASKSEKLCTNNALPNIGITWRGGIADGKTLFKEISLSEFINALRQIPANWYILQRNPSEDELRHVREGLGPNVYDISALNEDLPQMLTVLDQLDDHIGVSNTNVHLRSSLGKGGKVLVPNPPDWRWMAEGESSPWIPGYKIYRQDIHGGWESALETLTSDLQSECQTR